MASPRLVGVLTWLHLAAAAVVLVQLYGWLPVLAPPGWQVVLLSAAAIVALDARIAAGWWRAIRAGALLLALAWGAVQTAGWLGAPMAMPGNAPPAAVSLALSVAWVAVLAAASGVALRGGLGPAGTALLAAVGVTLWAVPAGEAFTAITALHPAALTPASAGWSRPSGLTVVLASLPLALVGWRAMRPHHPALAISRRPEVLYGTQAVIAGSACLRYGRLGVALIGSVAMLAFLLLPATIRRQRRAALLSRAGRGGR